MAINSAIRIRRRCTKSQERFLLITLTVLMTALAAGLYYRILSKGSEHAIDFHSYWYSGHFIWQQYDPYQAALEHREVMPPIHYLDGLNLTGGPVAQYGWQAMPANLAPFVLLVAPLARFSWPTATTIWTLVNLVLTVLIAWLLMRQLGTRPLSLRGAWVLLVLLSLVATREVIEYGQTTLLILAAMLAALVLGQQRPILAGVLLGIALSKYSLAFPAFLYFAFKRWRLGLAVSLGVQLLGILAIAAIGHASPLNVVIEYSQILTLHADLPGFHLAAGMLKDLGPLANVIVGLGSIGLWGALTYWYLSRGSKNRTSSVTDMTLLTTVVLWNLLTFYHRRYDHVADILFIAIIIAWISKAPRKFELSLAQRLGVWTLTGLTAGTWILPLYSLIGTASYIVLFNLCSVAALTTSVWLLFKVRPSAADSSDCEELRQMSNL